MSSGNKTRGFLISRGGNIFADERSAGDSAFTTRRLRIDALIAAIVALFIVIIVAGLAFSLWRARADALSSAEETAANLAQLAESQIATHLTTVDLALRSAAEDMERARAGVVRDLGDRLRERLQQAPFVKTILVIDSRGRLVRSTRRSSSMIADRSRQEYFSPHRENASSELYISRPHIGQVRGEWVITLSRRLSGPGGRFDGVVIASTDLAFFEQLFASIPVGQGGFVAMTRDDDVQLVRTPRIESQLGQRVSSSRIFSELLPRADAGVFQDVSPADGKARIYAYRLVPRRDVIVLAALGVDEVLKGWRTRVRVEASYAAGLIAATLLLGWFALREARRQEAFHRTTLEREAELSRRETLLRALEESETRFSRLADSTMDAIVTADDANRIVFFNAAAEQLFRRSVAEVIGQPLELLMPERYRTGHHAHLREFKKSGVAGRNLRDRRTITGLRSDGTEFPAEISISQIQVGGRTFFTAILHDITERKRGKEEILKLNADLDRRIAQRTGELEAANRELESFSYSVSHDLRAPLRHIGGFAKLLLDQPAGSGDAAAVERRTRYLQIINNSVERMNKLIDDLLALSRVGRVEMQPRRVDLNRLVIEAREESLREAKDRAIRWNMQTLPAVVGDASLLRIVLVNLFSNAVKFTAGREGALIEISAREGEDGEVVVCIKDNGAGFDMRHAEKLFGVFQRLHRQEQFEGSGVGLATVQRIVRRHGGRVWAEAEVDRGATFFMALKAASAEMPAGAAVPGSGG